MKTHAFGMTTPATVASNSVRLRSASVVGQAARRPTTRIEHGLLFATVALLPLETHVPAVMGFGFMSFVFGVLAIYVLLNRATILDRVWGHPVFLTAYGYLFVMVLLESAHPYAGYIELLSFAQMILGAILIASLCRDRSALRAGLYGWIASGTWVTVYLIFTSYGSISAMTATDFDSASEAREQVFQGMDFQTNLNNLAFFAAQGAVGAFALGLREKSSRRRVLFLLVMLTCIVGAFLPMSRGGVMVVAVACAAVMGTYGLLKARMLLVLALLAVGVWLFVPEAVYSRLVYQAHSYEPGKLEGRTKVYTAVLENLPDYVFTGVGAGHFWTAWGNSHGFREGKGILGAHNCFAQATIYWGLLGLGGFLAVIWQAYRSFPAPCGTDALKLSLLGTSVALLVLMMIMDLLYAKEFSIGLGLLVGASQWIWPRSRRQTAYQRQEGFVPSLRRRP